MKSKKVKKGSKQIEDRRFLPKFEDVNWEIDKLPAYVRRHRLVADEARRKEAIKRRIKKVV